MEKDRKNFTLRIDNDLHQRLKIQAIKENRSVSDIVNKLIRTYLDSRAKNS